MPTRIVLNETIASRQQSPRQRSAPPQQPQLPSSIHFPGSSGSDLEAARGGGSGIANPNNNNNNSVTFAADPTISPPSHKLTKSGRKVVQLRSSVFSRGVKRDELLVRRALSREDIRSSPRLLGYVFQLLASAVMLISVLKFYFNDEKQTTPTVVDLWQGLGDDQQFFNTVHGVVFTWKLIGCVSVATLGTAVNLLVVLVHFDTLLLPNFWLAFFRDGSRYEMYLEILMLVFWIVGIHINTSPLSVGNVQANVYFTTWISFVSSAINMGESRCRAG
jgi:hypothetical protein